MKILFGPLSIDDQDMFFFKKAIAQYDIKTFSAKKTLPYTMKNIFDGLPLNWFPEVLVFWCPEYYPFPIGIEDCPVPIIGIVTDGNLNFQGLLSARYYLDFIVSDSRIANCLNNWGYKNTIYALTHGFNPDIHCRNNNLNKIYDITFIGNLNHAVHPKRSPWLMRIARLSSKYRVLITSGVYSSEYAKILNQSKIVLNYTIQGTMNMRAFEVPACGSLLFIEEENKEVRNYLQDKIHCIYYNDENLEALLKHYIANSQERETIAQNGYDYIQQYSWNNIIKKLFSVIEQLAYRSFNHNNRLFYSLSPNEHYLARIRQSYMTITTESRTAVLQHYCNLASCYPLPQTFNDIGVITGDVKYLSHDIIKKHPLAYYNMAQFALKNGRTEDAKTFFSITSNLILSSPDDELPSPQGLVAPLGYTFFHSKWEEIYQEQKGDANKLNNLLLWDSCLQLGKLALEKGNILDAECFINDAIEILPDASVLYYYLAHIEKIKKNYKAAIIFYEKSIDYEPFFFHAWQELTQLLIEMQLFQDAEKYINEILLILDAFPTMHQEQKAYFTQIQFQLQNLNRNHILNAR